MKKHILFISQEMTYSGSPHSLLRMCKILKKNNYDISVWSFKEGDFIKEFQHEGIDVEIVPENKFENIRDMENKLKKFDLAICNTVLTAIAFSTLKRILPTIWYIREAENLEGMCKNNILRTQLLKNSEGIYCVSEYARDFIKKAFNSTATVVHNCVEDFNDGKIKNYFKNGKLNLLCLGTFEKRKGFDVIINAILQLPSHLRAKIHLKIAGKLREGSGYKEYYTPLLENINSIPEIEYIGEITNIQDKIERYKEADIVVVPSRDESCSLVALEGIMMNCPIIVTENVGAKYVVDENTGWVFKTDNTQDLTLILSDILKSKYNIPFMGKMARKKYEETSNMKIYEANILQMVSENINKKFQNTMLNSNKFNLQNEKCKENITVKLNIKDCIEKIKRADIISFDIFDTLLIRPYVKPTDLFYHIESNYKCNGFAEKRIDAEKKARKAIITQNCEDVTIDEIYKYLPEQYKFLKEIEQEYEYKLLRIRAEINDLYQFCKKIGKPIIITSDMYLADKFIQDVLKKNNYDGYVKLYLSSKERKTKRTGNLYQYIQKDFPNKKILHIGDNLNSDIKKAEENGFDTFWVEKNIDKYLELNSKARKLLEHCPNNVGASILVSMLANRNFEYKNYWEKLGYEYAGPVSYGYTHWIKESLVANNIKNVAFIARDGYTLQKVFALQTEEINSFYLYAPRILKSKIEESEKSKKEYCNYVNSMLGKEYINKSLAIVDTMTNRLTSQKIVEYAVSKEKLKGYYWAISRATNEIDDSYNFESYYPEPYIWNKSLRNWDFMELLMAAPEPPIIDVKNNRPIYKENISQEEKKRIDVIKILSKYSIEFTKDLLKYFDNINVEMTYAEISEWINILADYPSSQDVENIKTIKHAQNATHDKYVNLFPNWYTKIPVILSADHNYAPQMLVTIISILENKKNNTFYDFYLLVPETFPQRTTSRFEELKKKYSNFEINFIEMKDNFKSAKMQIAHITTPTYYRLLAADILPKRYEKAIYIDVDAVVLKDLSQFFMSNLNNDYVGGVRAAGMICYYFKDSKYTEYFKHIGISNMKNYINAGVTLWNLKLIRQNNLTPQLMELVKENYKLMDQDIINVVFQNHIKIMSLKYNFMTKYENNKSWKEHIKIGTYTEEEVDEAKRNPIIIHYADNIKPWNKVQNKYDEIWWQYARKTKYFSYPNFVVLLISIPYNLCQKVYLKYKKDRANKIYIQKQLMKMRIDIKNSKTQNNAVEVQGKAKITAPLWLKDKCGQGVVVETNDKQQNLIIKVIQNGKLVISFRGIDTWQAGTRFPVWVDYKSIKIDGKEILSAPISTWHDKPFRYEMPVKDGQVVKVDVVQQYHQYDKDELKDVILKLNPNSEYIKENIEKLTNKIYKKITVNNTTVKSSPQTTLFAKVKQNLQKHINLWKDKFSFAHKISPMMEMMQKNQAQTLQILQEIQTKNVNLENKNNELKKEIEVLKGFFSTQLSDFKKQQEERSKQLMATGDRLSLELQRATAELQSAEQSQASEIKAILSDFIAQLSVTENKLSTELQRATEELQNSGISEISEIKTYCADFAHQLGNTEVKLLNELNTQRETSQLNKNNIMAGINQTEQCVQIQASKSQELIQEQREILEKIQENLKDLSELKEIDFAQKEELMSLANELTSQKSHILEKVQNSIDEIREYTTKANVYYKNPFEVKTRTDRGLCDMTSEPDFENRFKALIKGLKTEDAATIVNIIKRLQLIKDTNQPIDLFSPAEKDQLRELKQYYQMILKVSDNIYCYKNYFLPINHFEASVFYYQHGISKLENKRYFADKDILDIGAFIGDSALILSPLTTKKVYCFEAMSENYNLLQQTIKLNNLKNIEAINSAVGAEKGEIELLYNGSGSSVDNMMVDTPKYKEKCSVITIDDYVKEHNLNVGLIKVDIEGAEQSFLKGAMRTIKEQKPTLLISIYHNTSDFLDIKPIIENWNVGYKFKIFKPTLESVSGETLLICEL